MIIDKKVQLKKIEHYTIKHLQMNYVSALNNP